MAIDVTGVAISQLNAKTSLNDDFMFLGCQGSTTMYSTWKVTFKTLSAAVSNAFADDKLRSIVRNEIGSQLGSEYFKKNASDQQNVTAPTVFNNSVNCTNTAQFYKGSSAGSSYKVTLPHDAYINPSGNGNSFTTNDDSRIASKKDITDAINDYKSQNDGTSEQILNIGAYSGSYVVVPKYSNKNYCYPVSTAHPDPVKTFYRYAGIRQALPVNNDAQMSDWANNTTLAESDSKIIRCVSGYPGFILTKSYRDYKSLTIVYLSESTPTSQVGSAVGMHTVTVPRVEIDLARQYQQYKKTFGHCEEDTLYFANVKDKWYVGGNSEKCEMYISTKCSDSFDDTHIPMFTNHSYVFIAVFGNK